MKVKGERWTVFIDSNAAVRTSSVYWPGSMPGIVNRPRASLVAWSPVPTTPTRAFATGAPESESSNAPASTIGDLVQSVSLARRATASSPPAARSSDTRSSANCPGRTT
jgi:hypothetical protein